MIDTQSTNNERPVEYIHRAVSRLSEAWMRPVPNRSGMRATFRRWRPDLQQEPTHEMRQFIWGWLGAPGKQESEAEVNTAGASPDEMRIVDQAAVLVAMRAIAGDHTQTHRSLGTALKAAELSDLRLMRLLTTPKGMRLEALYRALRLVDRENVGIKWSRKETERMLNFLYGSEEQMQQSVNQWAADFFAVSGKTMGNPKESETTQPQE